MEAGFAPGSSPLGENCPGWSLAVGWSAFVAPGNPASSCLNESKNLDNVQSGQRSQEITFDFISAEAGIYRLAQAIPGHRYRIEAWGKHIRSASPVELFLGVNLGGGDDWQAAGSVLDWVQTAQGRAAGRAFFVWRAAPYLLPRDGQGERYPTPSQPHSARSVVRRPVCRR